MLTTLAHADAIDRMAPIRVNLTSAALHEKIENSDITRDCFTAAHLLQSDVSPSLVTVPFSVSTQGFDNVAFFENILRVKNHGKPRRKRGLIVESTSPVIRESCVNRPCW